MRRDCELPDLLTVEEAAALLRVGRTKAYAMAKEWRATGGLSGLPVLDLGDVLRVPRWRLEAMVGGELHPPASPMAPAPGPASGDQRPPSERHGAGDGARPRPGPRRSSRPRSKKSDDRQLSLLHPNDVTDVSDVNASSSNTDRATEAK